jgi:hypothetical protein
LVVVLVIIQKKPNMKYNGGRPKRGKMTEDEIEKKRINNSKYSLEYYYRKKAIKLDLIKKMKMKTNHIEDILDKIRTNLYIIYDI